MAPIQATKAVKAAPSLPNIEVWRDGQIGLAENYADLGEVPWEKLRATEIFPGCRLDAEVLVVPEGWMPAGTSRHFSRRSVVPARAGTPADSTLAAKRDECVRRALYALWLPHNANSVIVESKPNTWRLRAYAFLRLAEWQFENRPSTDGSVFGNLTLSDVLTGFYPVARGVEGECKMALRILADAGERGVIFDYPAFFRRRLDANDHAPLEPIRGGAEALRPADPTPGPSVEPFSDEFVTEFLRRALWIQNNLADALLDHLERDLEIRKKYKYWSSSSRPRQEAIAVWRDRTSAPLRRLQYPWRLGKAAELSDAFPPPDVPSFYIALGILQGCNLGVVNACMGARSSEILAADDVPFGPAAGRYESRTFKLIDEIGGQTRDWPLHPAAERAVDLQRRLSKLLRPEGQNHLWVAMRGKKAGRLNSATSVFRSTVEYLGLSHLLGSGTAHMHRWRHTVARLVALSVVGAPKVLFDLFGHKDVEMTLHYMMSDPSIAEEAILVAKEMTYALAKEAVAEIVGEEASGPAAASLQKQLPKAMRMGEDVFDTKTLRETAEVLTHYGKYWSLVREGVICTKGLAQYGPCTKGRGAPDPGGCRTSCDYRFELSAAKQQCAEVLAALIRERHGASTDGLEMLVDNLDGQIVAELKRWDEVREKILAEHSDIKRVWEERRK
ncbi:integrase [Bradyrhizobium sp. LMG 9283]|uniref:integrase n=1 Tax=Bradyrhizobium sp. LMG 9283 TaxID=592064 RepID=UPI00388D9CF6